MLIQSSICPLAPWGLGPDGRWWWKPPQGAPPRLPMAEPLMGSPPPFSCSQQPHLSLPPLSPWAGVTEWVAEQLVQSARKGGPQREVSWEV